MRNNLVILSKCNVQTPKSKDVGNNEKIIPKISILFANYAWKMLNVEM